jgi:tRNA(Ile)-lysidine synthase
MLAPGDRAGVAVSGGADSVALFCLLARLSGTLGITLAAVHFDHSLRGSESDEDVRFVSELARRHGIEFISAREDVAAIAAQNRWNLEDAARRVRYRFFEQVVAEGHATRIAVAHTADDQAETVLARILRGTGPKGLTGIYPISGHAGCIVRPLLNVRREELRDYLRDRGETWREDSSNRDVTKQRARIREKLLPVLAVDFSPQIVDHLSQLARFSREEEVFWEALVEERFETFSREADGRVAIRASDLLSPLCLEMQRDSPGRSLGELFAPERALTERVIRRLYKQVRGDTRELGATHVEQVIHLASKAMSGKSYLLPGEILAERIFEDVIFSRISKDADSETAFETDGRRCAYHYEMGLPDRGAASISIPELGTRLCLKVIDWPFAERDTKRVGEALDAGLIRSPLILRSWRPGDAYRPQGHRQTQKLKQMFLAKRIPSSERFCWPVLESGGNIIWARGLPPAGDYCVSEQTRVGVIILEERL